jgi:DNA-binding IclR family transcriptional regulator
MRGASQASCAPRVTWFGQTSELGKPALMSYVKQESDSILSTLDKGLYVLETLSRSGNASGLTLTELSDAVGLHRTTLFRILATLQARNFVVRDESTDRYRIGMGVLELASMFLGNLDIRRVASPALEDLARRTQELVFLTVLDNDEVVTVERFDSNQTIALRGEIGDRRPAYCSAAGKAILAYLPDEEVDRILSTGMHPFTPRTISSPVVMQHHLHLVREHGIAWDDEERIEGVRCAAAPIFDYRGNVVGAVSLAAPSMRTPWERLSPLGEEVSVVAQNISRHLGYLKSAAPSTVISD